MENKQTAVEWLYSEFNKCIIGRSEKSGIEILQQAKAMEKEQKKDAYRVGRIDGDIPFEFNHTFEKYYEETYGK